MIAWGEARKNGCSDYTKTDLIMKRSQDGKNWSKLEVFHSGEGSVDTVGNAAPIVFGNNIVVLFNLNNSKVLKKTSKDLGKTWTDAVDVTASTTQPNWKWVGLGPPAGLRLKSGRLLIPAYHTNYTWDNGLISKGYALLSDDDGETWRMSADHAFGGKYYPNEDQAVELPGGRVAIFSRALGTLRTRTESPDGGEHWGPTEVLKTLPGPLVGCEGSTIACPDGKRILYSGPVAHNLSTLLVGRFQMAIYTSDDLGHTWKQHQMVDPGCSAYSAMTWHGKELGLLYERCDFFRHGFDPNEISFVPLSNPCGSESSVIV